MTGRVIEGKLDQLVGKIQERYGFSPTAPGFTTETDSPLEEGILIEGVRFAMDSPLEVIE
jgi:hypothetical protein